MDLRGSPRETWWIRASVSSLNGVSDQCLLLECCLRETECSDSVVTKRPLLRRLSTMRGRLTVPSVQDHTADEPIALLRTLSPDQRMTADMLLGGGVVTARAAQLGSRRCRRFDGRRSCRW